MRWLLDDSSDEIVRTDRDGYLDRPADHRISGGRRRRRWFPVAAIERAITDAVMGYLAAHA